MKVTSKKSISIPKLGWGISEGEVKDISSLKKEEQDRILAETEISVVGGGEKKEDKIINNKHNK